MISFLAGKIITKGQNFIFLRVGDVGYKVFVTPLLFAELAVEQNIELYTYQYVREDVLDLYGFRTLAELEMYELLLSISGIGPKSALGALSVANTEELKESISRGDYSLLTKVSGIGRKTAERVVLELREKVGDLPASGRPAAGGGAVASAEEIDALMALGYSLTQAREALRAVDPKIKDSGERIKAALRRLGG